MSEDFYSSTTYNSIETAICLEDIGIEKDDNRTSGKFCIPVITPTLSNNTIVEQTDGPVNTTNILSDINKSEITPCTISNYLELKLPNGVKSARKGDKFSVQFIGGDIDDPVLMQKR